MASQSKELIESKTTTKDGDGVIVATRTFLAWNDSGPAAAFDCPDALSIININHGVQAGSAHPDEAAGDNVLARTYTCDQIQGRSRTFKVVWTYSNVANATDFQVVQTDATAEFVDFFRTYKPDGDPTVVFPEMDDPSTNPWTDALGDGSWDTSGGAAAISECGPDIGGVPIDSGRNPTSYLVRQVEVTARRFLASDADFDNYLTDVGKRNSTTYLNFAVGKVVFLGYTAVQTVPNVEGDSQLWEVTFRFLADEFAHARQQGLRKPDTKELWTARAVQDNETCTSTVSEVYTKINCVYPVRWVQPYPNVSSFSGLPVT